LVQGNNNTKLFHGSISVTSKRIIVILPKKGDGEWVSDQDELKQCVIGFFFNLFLNDGHVNCQPMSNCLVSKYST
jgi:hypothetical protein